MPGNAGSAALAGRCRPACVEHLVSDRGRAAAAGQWLQSGCYGAWVPEEGVLLAIHGLARCGLLPAARAVLGELLEPYFDSDHRSGLPTEIGELLPHQWTKPPGR